jgi:transcriptional regulator with XRE-family HTH domain
MPRVSKTIHKAEYPVFLELLVEARKGAGLTQVQLAIKGGLSQPYVSAVERGGLRLDTLQLRTWLHACGSDLGTFGAELEKRLKAFEGSKRGKSAKVSKSKP